MRRMTAHVWRGGVVLAACNLLVVFGNYLFQCLIGRALPLSEYGYANVSAGLVLLLTLPVVAASNSVIHFLARMRSDGRHGEAMGLIASTQYALLLIVGVGLLVALAAVHPLTTYFDFPRTSLTIASAINVLVQLGVILVIALCAGMGWFFRAGVLAVAAIVTKLVTFSVASAWFPMAETALASGAASGFVYAVFALWWKSQTRKECVKASWTPWTREFRIFTAAAIASALASFAFTQSDVLIAQRNFPADQVAHFSGAGVFPRAMLGLAGPLLLVFYTSRSGGKNDGGVARAGLLAFYVVTMTAGAFVIVWQKDRLISSIFGTVQPEAAALMGRFALLMVVVGLVEIYGNWALASRSFLLVYAHLAAAAAYVGAGISWGHTPENLITTLLVSSLPLAAMLFCLRSMGRDRAPGFELPIRKPALPSPTT